MTKDKKDTKSQKKSKADKESSSKQDKTEKPTKKNNKETIEAGLTFNVKDFRRWMKSQFDVKDKENLPKFNGGHIALTASIECMLKHIIDVAKSTLQKCTSGLYELNKSVITNALLTDKELRPIFLYHLEKYDDAENYASTYTVEKKIMMEYIDTYFSKNVVLTTEGYNMLAYLLKKFAITITKYSKELLVHSGKKSLNGKTVISAVRILCSESLSNSINMKIEGACNITGEEEKKEKKKKDTDKEEEGDEEKEKKDKKKKKKDEEDDDDENEEDDESDDDNDDDENSDDDGDVSEPEEEEESDDEDQKSKSKKKDTKSKKSSK